MRANGFTQIELILTMALLASFVTVGFDAVRATVRRVSSTTADDRRSHDIDSVLRLIARDVRSACLSDDAQQSLFAGRPEGVYSRMDFQQLALLDDNAVEEIGYVVKRDADDRRALYRRSQTPADAEPLAGGREAYLCDITAFSLRFFDGETWRDTWGWDASEGRPTFGIRGLPMMVSVTLSAMVDGREVTSSRTIPVMVPLLNRGLGV